MIRKVLALLALFLVGSTPLQSGPTPDFAIDWYTIDGGGGTSTGADFSLTGTIGQFDAAPGGAQAGGYTLVGGFWGGSVEYRFSQGFEDS